MTNYAALVKSGKFDSRVPCDKSKGRLHPFRAPTAFHLFELTVYQSRLKQISEKGVAPFFMRPQCRNAKTEATKPFEIMYFEVKDGKVLRRQSGSSLGQTVYSGSPKAIKVVLSPDEKRVLILLADGRVRCVESKSFNFSTSGRIVYSGGLGPLAQDVAWEGNNKMMIKNSNGWRRDSV